MSALTQPTSTSTLHEELLRQATRLFASQGYDATSLQDIVNAASVTKGALYYYYASKEDILFEIHQRMIVYEVEHAQAIVAKGWPPREALRRLIVDLVESIGLFQDEVTVFYREGHRLSDEKRQVVQVMRDRYEGYFQEILEAGQRDGSLRSTINPHMARLGLFGMCIFTYTWYRPSGDLSITEVGSELASLLVRGLLPDDAAP